MRTHRAFTIVELLVVVAIIIALLAMLMPAMRQAILVSRITQCASNMRQTALVTQNYANDHFGVLPRHDFPQKIGRNPNAMARKTAEALAVRGLGWRLWFCPVRGLTFDEPAAPTTDAMMMDQMDVYAPTWLMWPNWWWVPRQTGNGPCPSMNGQTYELLPTTLRHPGANTMPIISDLLGGTLGVAADPSDPRQASGGHGAQSGSALINRGMLDGSVNQRGVDEVEPMIEVGLWWDWY